MFQQLKEWIKKHRSVSPLEPHISIQIQKDGFIWTELCHPHKSEHVRWIDIQEIFAYKQDFFTYDQIYISITYMNDRHINISENDAGYTELLNGAAKSLPGIRIDWFDEVAYPAFARKETLLYRKV